MIKGLSLGDFREFGARYADGEVIFTYELGSVGGSAIVLRKRSTGRVAARIVVPDEYRRGRVVSVAVSGYEWDSLTYMIEEGGAERLDPYAPLIVGRERWMNVSRFKKDYRVYGGFATDGYEWKSDMPRLSMEELIVYKAHVRGITMAHGLSGDEKGTYLGIISLIPELKRLGITAIELLPIYEFEELRYPSHLTYDSTNKRIKKVGEPYGVNYWGYGDGDYFAPKASYFGGRDVHTHLCEMVDTLHGAGIEVIMEISAAAGRVGDDLIISMLRAWRERYRIDGFHLLGIDYPIERIARDPFLADTKLFYENIPMELLLSDKGQKRLAISNDAFLYAVRRLQNHFDGNAAELAGVMRRQGDSYGYVNYASYNSGFTLYDSYSYGEKHNEANGEENRDGVNYNCSYNHGWEGETKRREINRARFTAMRTAFALILTSQGVPMLLAGDEAANTQHGNNNPYCQDNATGWVQYRHSGARDRLSAYVAALIAFRKKHPILAAPYELKRNDHRNMGFPDLSYHGREPWIMGIGAEKKAIGILYNGDYADGDCEDVMLCVNFYYGEETFALPKLPGGREWHFVTNTADEIFGENERRCENQSECIVPGGTMSIYVGRRPEQEAGRRKKRSRTVK